MRPVYPATVCLIALLFSACELKVKQAKTPPPPQPTAAKAEAAPSAPAPTEPLSTPQTQVRLPPPQPIDPDAVVAPPVYVADASTQRNKGGKKAGAQRPTASQAKPEPVETADTPQPPADAAASRLEPVMPESQRMQRIEEISARLRQVEQTLVHVKPANDAQIRIWQQIRNFADQAHLAEEQGDIQKASGLVERARLLVQDLTRAR